MEEIAFSYNWCEYLTPCPHNKDCMVGDYDCCVCEHNSKVRIFKELDIYSKVEYLRYFAYGYGCVNCNFNKEKKYEKY
jgi:hypothetical protein